jgi:hypothetical protein
MKLQKSQGQSLYEYAILLAIVVAVLTGMQVYLKRGIQGAIKLCSDEIGTQPKKDEAGKKDPTKGELLEARSTDITDGTATVTTLSGGTQTTISSQTTTKGTDSYSLYRSGFSEGGVSEGE